MKEKILIVDDDRDNVNLIRGILEEEGFETYGAYAGDEALKSIESFSYDLILLDIMLPGADGYEVCRRGWDKTDAHILYRGIGWLSIFFANDIAM